MSSSSSSSSSKSHLHNTAGQSHQISVDEYLTRCFQAIDDLADNPYLNGTLQSPDHDEPLHMGRPTGTSSASSSLSSSSSSSKRSQTSRSQTSTPVPKTVRPSQSTDVLRSVEVEERVPLVGPEASVSSSSKGEASAGTAKGFRRAFKRPSMFR